MKFPREPNNTDEFIRWLFHNRCIIDRKSAEVIHEIRPRSSGKDAMNWKNRVTLCNECHRQIHDSGVEEEEILALQHIRKEFLELIGRIDYV